MGFALAEECARRGAEVELVAGPVALQTHHANIHRTNVTSANEMYEAATTLSTSATQQFFALLLPTLHLQL